MRIFLVEDDVSLLKIARHHLCSAGYEVDTFTSGDQAWASFAKSAPDLVLTDLVLEGGLNGDQLLAKVKKDHPEIPVVMMTANGTIESAIECVKMGAWNYLTKPFRWDQMLLQLEKAADFSNLQKENFRLKTMMATYEDYEVIIGASKPIAELKKQLAHLSRVDAPVLIQGESGTGKELVARCLHLNSNRKDGPFIAVNCGAIVKELAESEFFGYIRGAFTGASSDKNGYFAESDQGTLFLDEIGELSLELQVKLLRVLQEGEFMPVGSTRCRKVNARIIAATHVDMQEAINAGDFREDLYFRMAVLLVNLPALRERREDIPLLVDHFLKKHMAHEVSIDPDLMSELKRQEWPGNVRELDNVIYRMTVLNPKITRLSLSEFTGSSRVRNQVNKLSYDLPEGGIHLDNHIKNLVESSLIKAQGNQTKAAKLLGITRSAIIYKMQKYGID
ncbi:MAG: sigma-54-dependent Fis family transcriptional regulator [Planctomycetes bacterium]|nr:sigma-54-dependent Fis family transcriptional regulator [Planctomycetota bacterium]